jgi:hypothetical protein
MRQYAKIDVVLGKALGVLSETELLQPVSDLLHRGRAPFVGLCWARVGKFIRQASNVVGSIILASSRTRASARGRVYLPDRFGEHRSAAGRYRPKLILFAAHAGLVPRVELFSSVRGDEPHGDVRHGQHEYTQRATSLAIVGAREE